MFGNESDPWKPTYFLSPCLRTFTILRIHRVAMDTLDGANPEDIQTLSGRNRHEAEHVLKCVVDEPFSVLPPAIATIPRSGPLETDHGGCACSTDPWSRSAWY